MHPFLLTIGSFRLGSYGVIYSISYLLAVALWYRLARREATRPESILDMAFTCLVSGVLGAKILMVIVSLMDGAPVSQILDPASLLHAAGVFHGAIYGGTIGLLWRARRLKVPLAGTLDSCFPGVALGQDVGKLGCYYAGCCYGTECHLPWAVTFTNPETHLLSGTPLGIPLHPVQLYTMGFNTISLVILLLAWRRRRFPGQVAALYFVLEGVQRSIIETWRGDLDRGIWLGLSWLSTSRITSLGLVTFGVLLWFFFNRANRATGRIAGTSSGT
jgi:phosphatidylglycerol---prolipoprotein diacylglyceryl transferase